MIIIAESIDASVGAAFFPGVFLPQSLLGVVSTRKFPIARAKILKFFMCVFYCA